MLAYVLNATDTRQAILCSTAGPRVGVLMDAHGSPLPRAP